MKARLFKIRDHPARVNHFVNTKTFNKDRLAFDRKREALFPFERLSEVTIKGRGILNGGVMAAAVQQRAVKRKIKEPGDEVRLLLVEHFGIHQDAPFKGS